MARKPNTPALRAVVPLDDVCLELADNSIMRKSAVEFFKVSARNPAPEAAKLTEQFIAANLRLTTLLDVTLACRYDGNDVSVEINSRNTVGAIPLISPKSGRQDFGLVVQPRFEWDGLGPMLSAMGWRIAPKPLKLPLLRRSERKVPPWVLSSMILIRIAALLESLNRKFEMVSDNLRAPRGRVDWDQYARRSMPSGNFLSIPCSYPDLQDDRLLKGAIRHTLEQQIASLQSQTLHGTFVLRLVEFAQSLLRRVQNVPIHIPTARNFQVWMQRPMRSDSFLDGLQAIEWTVEDRLLAGFSDLQGLPWRMPMDQFFEAWIETIFVMVARKTGAAIKTGRQRQTTHAIEWEPAYLGSQKSLVPDLWLEWGSTTLIVDAKYKRHWEELNHHSWAKAEEELRENHRADLFQVLAYANLAQTQSVVACLAYPCAENTWRMLHQSNRLIHKARISVGTRSVHLWLTAVPMLADAESLAGFFAESMRTILAA